MPLKCTQPAHFAEGVIMADVCDVTDVALEAEMERAAKEAAKAAAIVPPAEYECRECGAETTGARWCSGQCRDVWCRREGVR